MEMKPIMMEQIQQTVAEITKNYETNDVLMGKEGRRLPSRNTIILMLKELRRVMFPGYFGDEDLSVYMGDYFVGSHLNKIYQTLKQQIVLALIYNDAELSEEAATQQAEEISQYFISRLPYVQQMLLKDVQAGFDGDPAAQSKEDIIISYPGLFAIYVYRIAHELYLKQVPHIPRIMTEYAHSRTGIDINSGADIGEYFFIDHGTGVVIGETTTIGNHVKLYQGVTLGALSTRMGQQLAGVKRHPTIEDHVTIYSGSTILGGDTVIGRGTVIGGNAFITESVAADTKVIVKNPEMTFKGTGADTKGENTWGWEI
ncbi:MAG: serine acetyltransferase [Lachnospiraceae bacterium]|nr:serine acetyltransferase [Lachnospiraceae bacterium]